MNALGRDCALCTVVGIVALLAARLSPGLAAPVGAVVPFVDEVVAVENPVKTPVAASPNLAVA